MEALQNNLIAWLKFYNIERPHLGYRNPGRWPIEMISEYLGTVREAA